MFRKIMIIILMMSFVISIVAQEIKNDIIIVNYNKKSVAKAMLLSSLFPGAGQFYAKKSSITTYIFPAIEIGLWVGYLHFKKLGDDKTDDFEYFAVGENIGTPENPEYRYDRDRYDHAVEDFLESNNNPSYDDHFRLDETNTQHFYEDIGKYNKYIFGWADWFDIYATDSNGDWISIDWKWEENANHQDTWDGMENPTNPESNYYVGNESLYDGEKGLYSRMRSEYIVMRREANDFYETSGYYGFGIVANHILSAIDAVRLTRKYNMEYLSNVSRLQIKFSPVIVDNNISPGIFISTRF
ncbi:MAG: hypothetical protein K8R49_02525 [Candidatus Cloacimonetes bacterium]|nr:hypothetical protein [Candidatus Cloacimonadota bacterium]